MKYFSLIISIGIFLTLTICDAAAQAPTTVIPRGVLEAAIDKMISGAVVPPISVPNWLNVKEGAQPTKFGDESIWLVVFMNPSSTPVDLYTVVTSWSKQYGSKGLRIMYATQLYGKFGTQENVSKEAELDSLKRYFAKQHVTDPVAVADTGKQYSNFTLLKLPTLVLIGREGLKAKTWIGWKPDSKKAMESMIANIVTRKKGDSPVELSDSPIIKVGE